MQQVQYSKYILCAVLGDKSELVAMNTDSLLMCYNLFWFAAQHSPVAPTVDANSDEDENDGQVLVNATSACLRVI